MIARSPFALRLAAPGLALLLVARSAQAQDGSSSASAGAPVIPSAATVALTAPLEPDLPVITLDDAVNAALSRQPAVRQSVANERAAEQRVIEARSSFLPVLAAQVVASYRNPIYPGVITGSVEQLLPGLNATWTLDVGAYYRWRAAQASVMPLRIGIEATDEQTALNVRTAYFGVLAAEALVTVAKEQVDNQETHLAQIQAFVSVGTHPKIDLVTAQVTLGNAKSQLVQAVNAVRQAKVALEVAIGMTGPPSFEVQQTEVPPLTGEDSSADALLDQAIKARPDARQIDQQISAQQLTEKANRVEIWYPNLTFQGSYGFLAQIMSGTGPAPSCPSMQIPVSLGGGGGLFGGGMQPPPACIAVDPTDGTLRAKGFASQSPQSFSIASVPGGVWSVSATLNWTLYAGGLNVAQTREQAANLDALVAQRDALALSVRSEIDGDLIAIANDKEQIDLDQDTVEQAREQHTLAQGRYDAGVGNIIELGDAEAAVANAEGQLIKARYSLASDRAKLAKALGE